MPYLNIQANRSVEPERIQALLLKASQVVARELGKSERYVMVALAPPCPILFSGKDEPAAYLDLKSIDIRRLDTKQLSRALCRLMQEELGVPEDRVYIGFSDVPRPMWGWNGTTF